MELKTVNIGEIIPYENNPRKNDDAVEAVAESIRQCEYVAPIVVDENMVILAGHTRLKALKKLGRKTAEVVVREGLTEDQKTKYRILDNKTAELAEWDEELLTGELEDLDFDGFDFGFDVGTASEPEVEDDYYEPILPLDPKSRPGEIYILGHHHLMVGDATDQDAVAKLMGGVQADLFLTDPPYNVNYEGGTDEALKIANDRMSNSAFYTFLFDAFMAGKNVMRPGAAFYIWHGDNNSRPVRDSCEDVGLMIREVLIWAKNTFVLGRQDYHWQHEACLYGWKDGAVHYFIDDRKQSTLIDDTIPDIAKMKKDEMRELLEKIYSDKTATTVIHEKKPAASREHPTMKPVPLFGRLVQNSSRPGDVVLDTFGGSGTTMIACEQLGRRCYMMELDPHYADVIIDRWEAFTGEKAVLVSD